MNNKKTNNHCLSRRHKRLLFYVVLMAFPTIQSLIFQVYANINSILLAFQTYSIRTDGKLGYLVTFGLFDNMAQAFDIMKNSGSLVLNSLYLYLLNLVIVSTLALFFSYYIAKKYTLSGLFRVILFLPSIISQVAMVTMYETMVNQVFVAIVEELGCYEWLVSKGIDAGLLNGNDSIKYVMILIYNLWFSYGINVMIYTGAMSSIDPSIVESAQLDGVNFIQELIHIYVPLIWPTFTTFVVTGMTGILTSRMGLTVFFGIMEQTPFSVFGYFLYRETLNSDVISATRYSYSVLSAVGLIVTFVMTPLTLGVRKIMETYGPRTDK